jgi:hypothetical protein
MEGTETYNITSYTNPDPKSFGNTLRMTPITATNTTKVNQSIGNPTKITLKKLIKILLINWQKICLNKKRELQHFIEEVDAFLYNCTKYDIPNSLNS